MPEAMKCPHSVLVDEAVYVTAGGGHRTCVIHSYKLQTQLSGLHYHDINTVTLL